MGWLWNKFLKPLVGGALKVLGKIMAWSFTNPVASALVGGGLLLVAPLFKDVPFLESTFKWIGLTMISSAATGAVWGMFKEAGESAARGAAWWHKMGIGLPTLSVW